MNRKQNFTKKGVSKTLEKNLPMAKRNKISASAPSHAWAAQLKEKGLSVTEARTQLLETLKNSKKPLSIIELSHRLKARSPDPATIYRNVLALEKNGLLNSVDLGDRAMRFEISSKESSHHHHHISCKNCGKIECVPVCLPKEMIARIEALGFQDVNHQLSFQATCNNCAAL